MEWIEKISICRFIFQFRARIKKDSGQAGMTELRHLSAGVLVLNQGVVLQYFYHLGIFSGMEKAELNNHIIGL